MCYQVHGLYKQEFQSYNIWASPLFLKPWNFVQKRVKLTFFYGFDQAVIKHFQGFRTELLWFGESHEILVVKTHAP